MQKIIARAPTRIDLAGGTLDLFPIYSLLGAKATVNVAISLEAETAVSISSSGKYVIRSKDQNCIVTGTYQEVTQSPNLRLLGLILAAFWRADLPALEIATRARAPAGSGLGGSSTLAVTAAAALWRARCEHDSSFVAYNERKLAQLVQSIEARVIHTPTGCQDYWAAIRGGINIISYDWGGPEIESMPLAAVDGLDQAMVFCYSGASRDSAMNNWEIFKRAFDGDTAILSRLEKIGEIAEQCATAVRQGNFAKVLELTEAEWRARCELWPGVETEDTRRIDKAARRAGAFFTKVCGAGGGGCMFAMIPPELRENVMAAILTAGGTVLAATPFDQGLYFREPK